MRPEVLDIPRIKCFISKVSQKNTHKLKFDIRVKAEWHQGGQETSAQLVIPNLDPTYRSLLRLRH